MSQDSRWKVSFTPAVINTTQLHYGWQFGAGYQFNDRLELLTEFTINGGQRKDSSSLHSSYFRIKPELRYFFDGQEKGLNTYAGLQLSYTFRKWKDMSSGVYFDDEVYKDSAIRYSSAAINSPVFTSSVQLGTVIPIGNHFSVDFFTGVGLRMINTNYSAIMNASKVYQAPPKCMVLIKPDPAYWVDGTILRIHFNTGMRVLYRF